MKKFTLKPAPGEPLRLVEPARLTIPYRTDLNESQYEAVTSLDGPHLIIAGAGTGKTRTIVYRVAYLVELGVKPQRVLLLTFTRKASQEMLRRAAILLDSRCEQVAGGTFHSFANGVLRRYAHLLGFDRSFTILDQTDAEDVINLIRTKMKLDTREKRFPRKETLADLWSRSLNTITPVREILARDYPPFLDLEADITQLFKAYVVYKRENNLMDYDDLLVHLARLLQERPEVRKALNDQYAYVMVDEYQDTNRVQAEIVRGLAGERRNVMVVGDDAQCIYSFRGSTIRNILSFPEEYPGCKVIKIEENYRSTQSILDLANEVLVGGDRAPQSALPTSS
ncbi:MAG: ATP-dependent helicase [Bacteroidetes bacterium]|jgi:DNA helicase-2/ATP-dependent DNA helicase PcrA|nr:ATP-dependent helicase [Bacteroidota bacterium]